MSANPLPAVRVRRQAKGNGTAHTVHLLVDAGRTYCGKNPCDMDVVERLDVDKLPGVEGCGHCKRIQERLPSSYPGRVAPEFRFTAPSAPGRVRKTGSLSHGTRIHRGSKLGN